MFSVVHANHIEDLRDLVLQLIKQHPLSPLEEETFLVQSSGMGQWLQLAIAEDQGIAASMTFVLPSSFIWQAYRCVLGDDVPHESPFDRRVLTWRLMDILPAQLSLPAFKPLREYLYRDVEENGIPTARHTYQLAERLAALLDQYLVYRPDWIDAWSQGKSAPDITLSEDQEWQPSLWRAVLETMSVADKHLHRASLQQDFTQRLKELSDVPKGLPKRLFVFGISALPLALIEALHALSRHMDIVLLVNNPSRFYWGDIISEREALWRDRRDHQRFPDKPSLAGLDPVELHLRSNPLLSSWGGQGRDFIQSLYAFEQSLPFDTESDIFVDTASHPDATLLQQIQQDILDLAHPLDWVEKEGRKRVIQPDDESLRLVACHSPLREIEILHDVLLREFEADSSLKPRDIIIQVPDIDRYTPFIEAVFSRYEMNDRRHIPFSIADQRASQASPLLATVLDMLGLPLQRLTVSEVIDWLEIPAFRRRFDISPESIDLLTRWIEQSGIRWGISGQHREQLDLPPLELNTWRFGLKRMLLGYAMGNTLPVSDTGLMEIDPFDEIQGLDASLVGHLIDLIDSLEMWCKELSSPCSPSQWVDRINQLLEDLFLADDLMELDTLTRFMTAVEAWQSSCEVAEYTGEIPLDVMRDAVTSLLDEGGLSPRFLAGKVNFATLMPMRAIPFRQVYLLGMNDGEYPRVKMPQDFDLMSLHPRSGDRSRRDDDRYLMLEAVLAARDKLTLSWIGHEQKNQQSRPSSVLVSELLDVVTKGWSVTGNQDFSPQDDEERIAIEQRLIQHHPLQPFSPRYFANSDAEQAPRWPELFSYDSQWQQHDTQTPSALEDIVFPEKISLQALVSFLRAPSGTCLRDRLGVYSVSPEEVMQDSEPFTVQGLNSYKMKRDLLDGLLIDQSLEDNAQRLIRSGKLPALGFGDALLNQELVKLNRQWQFWKEATADLTPLAGRTVSWGYSFITIEEQLNGVFESSGMLQLWRLEAGVFGEIKRNRNKNLSDLGKPHRLLKVYLEQLLLAVSETSAVTAHVIFEDRTLHFPPVTRQQAQAQLKHYVSLWQSAWKAPYPAILELSLEWIRLISASDEDEDRGGDQLSTSGAQSQARNEMKERYEEGGFQRESILQKYPAIADVWPTFQSLEEAGFYQASEALYAYLYRLLEALSQKD